MEIILTHGLRNLADLSNLLAHEKQVLKELKDLRNKMAHNFMSPKQMKKDFPKEILRLQYHEGFTMKEFILNKNQRQEIEDKISHLSKEMRKFTNEIFEANETKLGS